MDLLRDVGVLASAVTRWIVGCDDAMRRFFGYLNSTLALRQVGWVGDKLEKIDLVLYTDADHKG